jgi:3-hydroxy-9,10-secoandrosta-1,3,5(10)-triene-9,17-dione monooxygenase reductase component
MPKPELDPTAAKSDWSLEADPGLGWGWGWGDHAVADWERPRRKAKAEPITVEQQQLRHVMGHFVTGVTVITTMVDSVPLGMTAQSFVSLSLDPPMVMFCPTRNSYTWEQIEAQGALCINVLSRAQEDLSRRFAAKSGERFEEVSWKPAPVTGSPLLEGVHAWIDCEIEDVHPGGDHLIVVCRVLALAATGDTGDPLVFYLGRYGDVTRASE